MIKIFGVGKKDHSDDDDNHTGHTTMYSGSHKNQHHDSQSGDTTHTSQHPSEDSELVGQVALDIVETESNFTIIAPIAGVDFEYVDVSIDKNILTISGRRELPDVYNDERVIIRNKECFWGDFVRNVILPENLDFDSVQAQMDNNLLLITIEKLRFKSSNIKINRLVD